MAGYLECSPFDYQEQDAGTAGGIAVIRDINQTSASAPLGGNVKVYTIDEAHAITGAASNGLLKILEEPPPHVYFFLCTTNPEKLSKILRTRCTTYSLSPLKIPEMTTLIQWVLSSEGKDIHNITKELIIRISEGIPRRALVLLGQVIDVPNILDQRDIINNATFDEVAVIDICRKLVESGNGEKRWKELKVMLLVFDQDPESAMRAILGYLSAVLLNMEGKNATRIANITNEFTRPYYDSSKSGLVLSCYMSTLL